MRVSEQLGGRLLLAAAVAKLPVASGGLWLLGAEVRWRHASQRHTSACQRPPCCCLCSAAPRREQQERPPVGRAEGGSGSASRRSRAWASVLHVNGVAVYVEEQDADGEGGAIMVRARCGGVGVRACGHSRPGPSLGSQQAPVLEPPLPAN